MQNLRTAFHNFPVIGAIISSLRYLLLVHRVNEGRLSTYMP